MKLLNYYPGKPHYFNPVCIEYKKPADQELYTKILDYMNQSVKYLSKIGFQTIIIGASGNINSAVASVLLGQVLGPKGNAVVVDFIDNEDHTTITEESQLFINIVRQAYLQGIVFKVGTLYQKQISLDPPKDSYTALRIRSRFINNIIFHAADNLSAAVLDITDKSERIIGRHTESFEGQIMPFYSLYKSEIYDLAKALKIPEETISKPPTEAELLEIGALGVSWQDLDPILYLLTEKQMEPEEIGEQYKIDIEWLKRLKKRIEYQPLRTEVSKLIL